MTTAIIDRDMGDDKMGFNPFIPYPLTFIYYQDHINIDDKMAERRTYLGADNPNWRGGKVNTICKQCGIVIQKFPSQIIEEGNFCSPSCIGQWRSENRKGKESPRWKRVKRVCEYCGGEFDIKISEIKRGRGKCCSPSCSRKMQRFPKHHTKIESIFEEICQQNNLPFRYVGDGQLWIGKDTQLNPDFIECNGKKIAIFINGDYWHSPLLRYNIRDSQRVDVQVKICKRHKWTPIIIWESDLKREDAEQFVLSVLKKEGGIDG